MPADHQQNAKAFVYSRAMIEESLAGFDKELVD